MTHEEAEELNTTTTCNLTVIEDHLILVDKFSSFNLYKRVTAWIIRFIHNCKSRVQTTQPKSGHLTTDELILAMNYWCSIIQRTHFPDELRILTTKSQKIPMSSKIYALNPFVDDQGILRVSGRQQRARFSYNSRHPIILDLRRPLTKLLIRSEHIHLLHGGSLLVSSSLFRNFHLLGGCRAIRSIVRSCVICRRRTPKTKPQMMGQLPPERITPDVVFEHVGLDFAGPLYLKRGFVHKPTILKSYVCVFVSMSVKALHLELVSDLSTKSFIACLRRFVARRGKPSSMWSDHGTNLWVPIEFSRISMHSFALQKRKKPSLTFAQLKASHGISSLSDPPHFGGLWEAAVKSFKTHLTRVIGNSKLNFEEMTTIFTQVEACLNSRLLSTLPHNDDDGIEVLTPGHFLIGHPLQALPDHPHSSQSLGLLRRWYLCQGLVRHFWQRWKNEYIVALRRYSKWKRPNDNFQIGDIVVIKEDNLVLSHWSIA